MKTFSVGLLLPTSSIHPMGKEFDAGLKKGLRELTDDQTCEVKIIPEFVGQGSTKSVVDAISKLNEYYDADIITGIVSNKVAAQAAEKTQKVRTPLLISNIGEHLPDPRVYNAFTFLHSSHTWKQVWSLGSLAVKKFGKKGMFVAGIYDTGYSFMEMLSLGMKAADPESELSFSIAQLTGNNRTVDPKTVFQHIEEYRPDFLMAAFCGTEATEFLEEFVRRGMHKTVPLISLPFLLESFEARGEEIEVYTTTTSSQDTMNGKAQGSFAELGYETGRIIAEAYRKSNGKDMHEVLKAIRLDSDQGALQVNADATGKNKKVFLVKNLHSGDKQTIKNEIVEELGSIEIDDPTIVTSLNEVSSGWENPYLGV